VPELPEVEAVRRRLSPVLRGALVTSVLLRRADLRRPFPADFATRVRGATIRRLTRRGKYLLADLSSGETLVMHLGMSGSFRVDTRPRGRPAPDLEPRAHDHVVFEMSSGAIVTFNDPRRFGVMDLVPSRAFERHAAIGALGPEPLSASFDAAALARACAGKRTPLKVALLDQRVVAGLGNIYASEALHLARLSPKRRAATIATATGEPRDSARRLATAIKSVLLRAIARRSGGRYRRERGARFRVYDREGRVCPTRGCPGMIARITQAGRSTFYCRVCQR
jgi:formamidopyrimidine-DNA glycosylase